MADTSLGLRAGSVLVVPYDPAWAALFVVEAERLQRALTARGLSLAIEHTGSTAVRGLPAKPVLDLLVGWTSSGHRPAAIAAFEEAGYVYRGEQGISGRDFFRRGDPRQYHLHLVQVGSVFWTDHRSFRDYLRLHPEVAAAYGQLKLALARKYPHDREAYIDGKTAFVQEVLARARITAL